jgi:hypothetical protein
VAVTLQCSASDSRVELRKGEMLSTLQARGGGHLGRWVCVSRGVGGHFAGSQHG